jgi:NAD(P)-dependent dehydrogenase (short-subunit alcohol dehydrogenase family)
MSSMPGHSFMNIFPNRAGRTAGCVGALDERYTSSTLLADRRQQRHWCSVGRRNTENRRAPGGQFTLGGLVESLVNAGTCEYVDARQRDASIIEHVVRTNLLASSYCIDAAVPLLRAGTAPHLVGMASPATYLPLPRAEAHGTSKAGLRYLFESLRRDLAADGIEVTMVSPGFVDTLPVANNDVPIPVSWPVDKAARYIFDELKRRPPEIALPAPFMAALWPLSKRPDSGKLAIGKRMVRRQPPIKDQP